MRGRSPSGRAVGLRAFQHAPDEGLLLMQRRVRRLAGPLTLAGVALIVSVPAAHATPASKPPLATAVKRSLDRLVAAGAPGAVVLVREHGRTLRLAAGYADTR